MPCERLKPLNSVMTGLPQCADHPTRLSLGLHTTMFFGQSA
jgi:hypothetical protein